MITITSTQISDIIDFAGSMITDLMPALLFIAGVLVAVFILQSLLGVKSSPDEDRKNLDD